jgi:hypothetical protein
VDILAVEYTWKGSCAPEHNREGTMEKKYNRNLNLSQMHHSTERVGIKFA